MSKKQISKILVIIILILCIMFFCKNRFANISKSPVLSDYPDSIWYSEETGYMIEIGKEEDDIGITVEYEDSREGYYIICDNGKYWVRYGQEYVGVTFETDISQEREETWLTLSGFSPLGKETSESRKKTKEIFERHGEIVFQKVPKQHIVDYPDSVWKSEETGYTVTIPNKEKLEEEEIADIIIEYNGKKKTYEMCETLYSMPAAGEICYPHQEDSSFNSEREEEGENIFFHILFMENRGDMYMKLYDFENPNFASTDCKKKNREIFMKYGEVVFKRVRE